MPGTAQHVEVCPGIVVVDDALWMIEDLDELLSLDEDAAIDVAMAGGA